MIKIAQHDGMGIVADTVIGRCREGAVAVAQQHADRRTAVVGDDEIGQAIAVEIAGGQRDRPGTGGEVSSGLEGVVAVAEQDANIATAVIGDGEVKVGIGIEPGSEDKVWAGANGVSRQGLERAVRIIERIQAEGRGERRAVVGAVFNHEPGDVRDREVADIGRRHAIATGVLQVRPDGETVEARLHGAIGDRVADVSADNVSRGSDDVVKRVVAGAEQAVVAGGAKLVIGGVVDRRSEHIFGESEREAVKDVADA